MTEAEAVKVEYNRIFKGANETRKRYRIFKGGAGSGKSVNVARDFVEKLSDPYYRGANLLVVRKVEETHRSSTFAELVKAIRAYFGDGAGAAWIIPKGQAGMLYLKSKITGAEIRFAGCNTADAIDKLKSTAFASGALTWIWVEEASEITAADFEILDDRLRGLLPNQNLYYQITLTFNPVRCWIKGRFFDLPDADGYVCESTYRDNRFIDPAYYRRMETRKERDPQGYKIYGLNEWGDLDGLIFTDYSVKDFDRKAITDRAYGQDFGYSHANAILDVGFSLDDIYVCDEIYVTERDTVEIIELANAKGLDRRRVMYCDSAEPDRIKMWRKAGYNAVAVSKEKNSVQGQIEWIKGNGEKGRTVKRTIYIHPDCVNTIKEIGQWSRKKDMKTNTFTEEPVDAFDDAMAALRYSVEGKRKPKALPFVL